jgi:hypothetical protein
MVTDNDITSQVINLACLKNRPTLLACFEVVDGTVSQAKIVGHFVPDRVVNVIRQFLLAVCNEFVGMLKDSYDIRGDTTVPRPTFGKRDALVEAKQEAAAVQRPTGLHLQGCRIWFDKEGDVIQVGCEALRNGVYRFLDEIVKMFCSDANHIFIIRRKRAAPGIARGFGADRAARVSRSVCGRMLGAG